LAPRSSKRVPGAGLKPQRIHAQGAGKFGTAQMIVRGCTGSNTTLSVSGEHGVEGAATRVSRCGVRNVMR
jgi:hypothetical protein